MQLPEVVPASSTWPSCGRNMRYAARSNVVLPLPFGPMMPTTRLPSTSRLTSEQISTEPTATVISDSVSISGTGPSLAEDGFESAPPPERVRDDNFRSLDACLCNCLAAAGRLRRRVADPGGGGGGSVVAPHRMFGVRVVTDRPCGWSGCAVAVPASGPGLLAEREGFEPSRELQTPYSLSRRAPSTSRPPLLWSSVGQSVPALAEGVGFEPTRG